MATTEQTTTPGSALLRRLFGAGCLGCDGDPVHALAFGPPGTALLLCELCAETLRRLLDDTLAPGPEEGADG